MQITQKRSECDLMTNSVKFMQQMSSTLSEGDSGVCPPSWSIVQKLKQVLKTTILGTDTSSQTFTPFIDMSIINDCMLQPMWHFKHPLLQFADITDPLLSTNASFSRFYSHGIQTWAAKAKVASCLARWILRSHMQYAIKIDRNGNFQVSQGNVATQLRWGGRPCSIYIKNFLGK